MDGRRVAHAGPRKSASKEDLRTQLAELSGGVTATRDDAQVAEELHEPLNTAGFCDELFHYIRESGAWPLLEALDPGRRVGAA